MRRKRQEDADIQGNMQNKSGIGYYETSKKKVFRNVYFNIPFTL